MANITPTLQDQRWGPERYQVFDYYAHPKRDAGGNPCLIFRHGGGGIGGNYKEIWKGTDPLHTLHLYLNDSARGTHFDIVSFESAQRNHLDSSGAAPSIPRTKTAYLHDQIIDAKRAVGAIKQWGQGLNNNSGFHLNPNKFIFGGHSHGAVIAGLCTLTPPIAGHGGLDSYFHRIWDAKSYDSTCVGAILSSPQVDVRNLNDTYPGTAYIDYTGLPGWYSTRANTSSVEWDNLPRRIKESMSIRHYIDKGQTRFYRPFFVIFEANKGTHTHPFTEVHDSQQYTDLTASLAAQKLSYSGLTYTTMTDVENAQVYAWMANLVYSSTLSGGAPVPL